MAQRYSVRFEISKDNPPDLADEEVFYMNASGEDPDQLIKVIGSHIEHFIERRHIYELNPGVEVKVVGPIFEELQEEIRTTPRVKEYTGRSVQEAADKMEYQTE